MIFNYQPIYTGYNQNKKNDPNNKDRKQQKSTPRMDTFILSSTCSQKECSKRTFENITDEIKISRETINSIRYVDNTELKKKLFELVFVVTLLTYILKV